MKKFTALYLFLFALLVTGAFASMAQYAYGLRICGIASLGFAIAFLYESIKESQRTGKAARRWINELELIIIAGVALIFTLRNFSVDFPMSVVVMSFLLLALLCITIYHAIAHTRLSTAHGSSVALPVFLYYGAVILFIIALLVGSVLATFENAIASAGIVLSLVFFVLAFLIKGSNVADDENISTWQYMRQLNDKSAIFLTTGLLFGVLNVLVAFRVLPPLYRGTMPDGYQHLVDQGAAESGSMKGQEFKDQYEKFMEHQRK